MVPLCTWESTSRMVPYDNGQSQEDEHGENIGTNLGQFALEHINLIREKDDRRAKEPLRVDNALE